MIGISPEETLDVCQRLSARTRLATAEEKLLQQTLSELKNAVSKKCMCFVTECLHIETFHTCCCGY